SFRTFFLLDWKLGKTAAWGPVCSSVPDAREWTRAWGFMHFSRPRITVRHARDFANRRSINQHAFGAFEAPQKPSSMHQSNRAVQAASLENFAHIHKGSVMGRWKRRPYGRLREAE